MLKHHNENMTTVGFGLADSQMKHLFIDQSKSASYSASITHDVMKY